MLKGRITMRTPIGEAIKKAMKDTNTTQTQMARLVGAKSQSVISERLKMSNLSINTVVEMLDAIGYDLVIEKRKQGRRREDRLIIGKGDKQ